jgi:hypothetical protein
VVHRVSGEFAGSESGPNGTKLRPFLDNLTTDGTDFTNSRGHLCLIPAYPWIDSLRLRFSARGRLLLKLPYLSAIRVRNQKVEQPLNELLFRPTRVI